MPVIASHELIDIGRRIFAAAGAPESTADTVARGLVNANLTGHESHGIRRVPEYLEKVRIGELDPTAQPSLARSTGAVRIIDGNNAFGQVVAPFGADQAVDAASNFGIGCAVLTRVGHIGRLGDYAERMARNGYIATVFASGSLIGPQVAIYGGREPIFTTNPYAWAVPRAGDARPLLIDCATAAIAGGKVRAAIESESEVPPGCLLDADGKPTRDPQAHLSGGTLLPFGGHKGSGLMMMIELSTTLLAGYAPVSSQNFRPGNPAILTAFAVETFRGRTEFESEVEDLCTRIKESRLADGFDEILLPGEPEIRSREEKLKTGIELPESVWTALRRSAGELEVDIERNTNDR